MQTHPLRVSDARGQLEELRAELMIFTDVLDVFSTGRGDIVMVVCLGRPHPAEWGGALRAAGYTIPPRRHAGRAEATPELDLLGAKRLEANETEAAAGPPERTGVNRPEATYYAA